VGSSKSRSSVSATARIVVGIKVHSGTLGTHDGRIAIPNNRPPGHSCWEPVSVFISAQWDAQADSASICNSHMLSYTQKCHSTPSVHHVLSCAANANQQNLLASGLTILYKLRPNVRKSTTIHLCCLLSHRMRCRLQQHN
jgi:hypothetical protein